MTLEEASKQYNISLEYSTNDNLWRWCIRNSDKIIGAEKGYYNPNTAKLELIEYLKDFDDDCRGMA